MFKINERAVLVLLIATAVSGASLSLISSSTATPAHSSKIRRTILLKFKPEASTAAIQKILKEVKENIAGIKGVRNIVVGAQIVERAPFNYGISMDFDDEAAFKRYRADEGHRGTHNKYADLVEQAQISDIRDD
jgi:hypothetical protein